MAETGGEEQTESISKSVASLPPEKMFELMKQMKELTLNNGPEAKQMLLQNQQLCYALLQAQVVMRIVDPMVVMRMLKSVTPQEMADFHRQFQAEPEAQPGPSSAPEAPPQAIPPGYVAVMNGRVVSDEPTIQLLTQVLSLRESDIVQLPKEEQAEIRKLRETIRIEPMSAHTSR